MQGTNSYSLKMDYHVCGFSLNVMKLCFVMIHFYKQGDSAEYSVYKGFRNGTDFVCGKDAIIQCQLQSILPTFNWYIGKDALTETNISARCTNTATTCQKNPNLPSSYSFSFDSPGKQSNLTISPVTSAENSLQFFCNDGATNKFFKASLVVIPDKSGIVNKTRPLSNGTEFTVTTNCIYPANLTTISWYSSLNGGLDRTEHLETKRITIECESTSNDCKIANESKNITSVLTLSLPNIQSPRIVGIEIIFDNISLFSVTVGEYINPGEIPCNKWWCLPCWVFGVIVAGLSSATFLINILIKFQCSGRKVGLLRCWELSAIVGLCALVICLIIIIVVAGICRDCNSTKRRQIDCWIIYIIILGILVACASVCILVYITKEPVGGLKVVSRKSNGKMMAINLEWTSRLHNCKTFYMVLNNEKDSRELDCTVRKDGIMEFELTDLKLDYDYVACLYSTMCVIQSSKNQIEFNTKGRPLPPYNVCEDETLRTESSVTLTWKPAKGLKHHFIIKYQRSKGKNRNWMYTEKIYDIKYTIEGLKPNTSYTLIINAENDIGSSEDSEPLYVKTRALQPIPPEDFRCISIKESEVILSWKPSGQIKKQEFLLTIYKMSEDSKPGKKLQDTEISIPNTRKKVVTHKVTDLKPGSKYLFELFSAAGRLISERSAITSVETEDSGDFGDGVPSTNKGSNSTSVFHVTHN